MSHRADIKSTDHWYKGEDQAFEYTVEDDTGTAVDITGWNFQWVLKAALTDSAFLIEKTSSGGGVSITDAANGVFQVQTLQADVATLDPGSYHYAVRRTDAGSAEILATGTAVLQGSAVLN